FLTDGLLADPLDEAPGDLEVDVRLEEGNAYFTEGLDDILLRQPAITTEPVEDAGEATREAVQHGFRPGADFWKRSRILARYRPVKPGHGTSETSRMPPPFRRTAGTDRTALI